MNKPALHQWCRIRLADVICPERGQVLMQITPELEVEGEVVFVSDHGQEKDGFAIVEVRGIVSPLIVPMERVRFSGRTLETQKEVAGNEVSWSSPREIAPG